jgi:peptidoglycan/LPS O-acetylase OafA/YrhL
VIYPFIASKANDPVQFLLRASAIIAPFLILTLLFGLVDVRFYEYYLIYIVSIQIARVNLDRKIIESSRKWIPFAVFAVAASTIPLIGYGTWVGLSSPLVFLATTAPWSVMVIALGLSLFVVGATLRKEGCIGNGVTILSQGSYAIYLVHYPILVLLGSFMLSFQSMGLPIYLPMAIGFGASIVIGLAAWKIGEHSSEMIDALLIVLRSTKLRMTAIIHPAPD